MNNFSFYSPTEFIFGKETELQAGKYLKKYGAKKVLLHYGGSSAVKSGLLQRIKDSLEKDRIEYIVLGGVQPNPVDTLVYEGIDLCKKESVDMILAVGGGSVIDSAKAIAAGALYDGDFWDFFDGKRIERALKVATVLTIPAAGSEGSQSTVITNTREMQKRGAGSPLLRPVFSILNPELTFTLPPFQTACGIADMMAHVMERYFTNTKGVEVTTNLCEAVLKTIIDQALIVIKNPSDYDAQANIMWSGTIAHNGICGVGREEDWASHEIEHELSALYDVAHGAGLAVIFPAWMTYVMDHNIDLFARFAVNVWNVADNGNKKEVALKGIEAIRNFFVLIGLPVNFEQLGARKEDIDLLVERLHINQGETVGHFKKLTMEDVKCIYQLASN